MTRFKTNSTIPMVDAATPCHAERSGESMMNTSTPRNRGRIWTPDDAAIYNRMLTLAGSPRTLRSRQLNCRGYLAEHGKISSMAAQNPDPSVIPQNNWRARIHALFTNAHRAGTPSRRTEHE